MINNHTKTEDIIEYFNNAASTWDECTFLNDKVINNILDNVNVIENKTVLDVACGTGVLIPYYLQRNVKKITAIDISEKMIEIAENKFNETNIKFICEDIINFNTCEKYDCIVVYNSFPHFINQEELIKKLSSLLNVGGYLTIAHSMSRDTLNKHHQNVMNISQELMTIEELANLCEKYLSVEMQVSNDNMYQIVAKYNK